MLFKKGINRFPFLYICAYLKFFITKNARLILTTLLLLLLSCKSGGDKNAGSQVGYDSTLAKGKVTDSIVCRNGGQMYALYLPSYYTTAHPFPCIYFFDAHARGALPLRKYKDIAEKYGFVMIGSDASRNGMPWNENNEEIQQLLNDTRDRINIDSKRVYTCGLSGGARVACTIAIADGGIAGVIGCAAGFPQSAQEPASKFDYFGIAGVEDFNITEMRNLDDALEREGYVHQFLTADGKHAWPTPDNFETALLWMQAMAMKRSLQPKNDTIIGLLQNDIDTRINMAMRSGEWIPMFELCSGALRNLGGLVDTAVYRKQLAGLRANAAFQKSFAEQNKLQAEELNEQQQLAAEFPQHDDKWWAQKIAALKNNTKKADRLEAEMNSRLLAYLSLVGYMYSSRAINQGDAAAAETYLKLFKTVDPENPDCSYLAAVNYNKLGQRQQALSSLREAASLGYNEISTIQNEPAFSNLHGNAAFSDILAAVRKNYTTLQ